MLNFTVISQELQSVRGLQLIVHGRLFNAARRIFQMNLYGRVLRQTVRIQSLYKETGQLPVLHWPLPFSSPALQIGHAPEPCINRSRLSFPPEGGYTSRLHRSASSGCSRVTAYAFRWTPPPCPAICGIRSRKTPYSRQARCSSAPCS